MIYVDSGRCNGCRACLEVCPEGAISMQGRVAYVEESLCKACELCLEACPEGAILAVEAVEAPGRKLVPAPPELVPGGRRLSLPAASSRSLRDLAAPAVGAALLWTGREVVPRVAALLLDLLDRRSQAARGAPLGLDTSSRQRLASANRMPLEEQGLVGMGRGRRRERRHRNRRGG